MTDHKDGRPVVVVLTGMSLDGRISVGPARSSRAFDENLPSGVSELLRRVRAESDAVMVGVNTVKADDPRLKCADNPHLLRIIIDSKCHVPVTAKVVRDLTAPTLIVTSNSAPQRAVDELRSVGVEVMQFGENRVDLVATLGALRRKGVSRLLVEGGGRIIGSLLAANLLDELRVVIFPFIVGDRNAASLAEVNELDGPFPLRFLDVTNLAEHHLLARYVPAT